MTESNKLGKGDSEQLPQWPAYGPSQTPDRWWLGGAPSDPAGTGTATASSLGCSHSPELKQCTERVFI